MLEYSKMTMKEVDALRAKVRDAGGQLHVVKNTLMSHRARKRGYPGHKTLEGTSLVGFAITRCSRPCQGFRDVTKNSEIFKLKGGYLDPGTRSRLHSIKSLADLPPLPVMRANFLGLIQAPASKLVRTLAEPARSVAYVVQSLFGTSRGYPNRCLSAGCCIKVRLRISRHRLIIYQ